MAGATEPATEAQAELSRAAYDALVDAAETYRAALLIRLAGEAGLRTGEITRVRPSDLRETGSDEHGLLTVYDDEGRQSRTTHVPPSLVVELRRYADSMDLTEDERFVDVSERRVQMIVDDTTDRAAQQSDAVDDARITPRMLRQFFARDLLTEREIDPRVVRAIGGWETLGALDPYLDQLQDPDIVDAFEDGARDEASTASLALDLVADVLDVVATAGTREELVTRIPERLVGASDWDAAWIATRERMADEFGVAATAGIDAESLSKQGLRTTDEDAPWMRAVDVAETTDSWVEPVVSSTGAAASGAAEDVTGGVEQENLASGVDETIVAVPLSYGATSYGVLCLLEGESDGLGAVTSADAAEQYRQALGRLGGCVGRSLASFRWHDLLHSDTVLELEFETGAPTAFPVRLTDALGCRLELASTVATRDALLLYVDVDGANPHDVGDVLDPIDGIDDTRVVETRDDGCTMGIGVTAGSPALTMTEHGATVRAVSASDGKLRVVADVPIGTDVRPLVEGLRQSFPDASLVSKRELDRDPGTGTAVRDGVEDRLTDRQHATLKAAYHGGYFDWPREITAEEVADAMDVSPPTLHNHLRKGQRALLDGLFDGSDRP